MATYDLDLGSRLSSPLGDKPTNFNFGEPFLIFYWGAFVPAGVPQRGFIRCYGLFWSAHEVIWSGAGNVNSFRLLGRVGKYFPKLRVCDFREQTGVYVLYDDYGPYYVGLVRNQPIGNRLRAHTQDKQKGNWDRFSWFGFRRVLIRQLTDGTRALGKVPQQLLAETHWTIGDIEALLIQSLGTWVRGNGQQMKFAAAQEWAQVMSHEVDHYLTRL